MENTVDKRWKGGDQVITFTHIYTYMHTSAYIRIHLHAHTHTHTHTHTPIMFCEGGAQLRADLTHTRGTLRNDFNIVNIDLAIVGTCMTCERRI